MVQPQAPGFPPAAPPRTRSRAGGIMLAIGGLVTLVTVFALPWERFRGDSLTLWEFRQDIAFSQEIGFFSAGEALSYQVPFYTGLAAGLVALLVGVLTAAVGNRITNGLATLGGLFASFLAIFTPLYYFFRIFDIDDVDILVTDAAGVGYWVMLVMSFVLFVATIVTFVGVFRAGRIRRPAASPYPAYPPRPATPQPPGYSQPPGHAQQPGYPQQPAQPQQPPPQPPQPPYQP